MNKHGYLGAEKNRMLGPKQVLTARVDYRAGRVQVKELASIFGMSPDSIRKMLRGDTYGNVGEMRTPARESQAGEVGGSLDRLRGMLSQVPEETSADGPQGSEF